LMKPTRTFSPLCSEKQPQWWVFDFSRSYVSWIAYAIWIG
jgi:hypothetical protein